MNLLSQSNRDSNITIETCHHYLSISSDVIHDTQTEYKCDPPIRTNNHCERLWRGIINHEIDLLSSGHLPCTPGQKCLTYGKNRGNFLKANHGISSLQFGLSLFWTKGQKYGIGLKDIVHYFCARPAKFCGLNNDKGEIAIGYDADFCVWNPDEIFTVTKDIINFKNTNNPYMGQILKGCVHATIVRGYHVYGQYENFTQPFGKVLRRQRRNDGDRSKRLVKFV